jgi:hypothetical protein
MITQTQIMWTCLPNGVAAGASPLSVKLSLVVTPQLLCNGNGVNSIGGTVFENWPAYVRAVDAAGGWLVSFDNTSIVGTGAMVDNLSASSAFNVDAASLWQAIFPASTPVVTAQTATSTPDYKILSYDAGRIAGAVRAAHAYAVYSHVTHGKLVMTGSDPYSHLLAERKKARAVLPKMTAAIRGIARGSTHEVLRREYEAETGDLGIGYELMRHAIFYDPVSRRAANDRASLGRRAVTPDIDEAGAPAAPPALANDFNTLLAHLGGQPQLLRKLGLIIDLTIPLPAAIAATLLPAGSAAPSVTQLVWLSTHAATTYQSSFPSLPLQTVHNVNPSTMADMTLGLFRTALSGLAPVTATTGGSINNGFLPLGDPAQYTTYTEDTEGTPFKLDATDSTQAQSSALDSTPPLPALRTAGIAVAQKARETVLTGALGRQQSLKQIVWFSANPSDAVFAAEDVVRGYAIEVAAGPSPTTFQSLCLRDSRLYFPGLATIAGYAGPLSFVVSDEGYTKATAATSPGSQAPPTATGTTPAPVPAGTTELNLHTALFGWEGWSLAAQRPGRAITAAIPAGDVVQTETPLQPVNTQDASFPSCQFTVRSRAGTLTRLRFGQSYTFRARVLDLAGNDMSVASAGMPEANRSATVLQSPTTQYLRYEPVANPVLVLQSPLTEGEHLENLVIRSNPWGATPLDAIAYAAASAALSPMNAYSATSARWIAPPKGAWGQAETLGAFDANYFGPMSAALEADIAAGQVVAGSPYAGANAASFLALKNALFQCSQKEAGLFTDTRVWNSADTTATFPSAANPVQIITPPTAQNLPPPTNPGQPLAPGQYNILQNSGAPVYIPYLPDANAQGVALQQLSPTGSVLSSATRTYAPRAGCAWPEIDLPQVVLEQAPVGAPLPSIGYGASNPAGLDSGPPPASTPGSTPSGFVPPAGNAPITFALAPGAQLSLTYGSTVAAPGLMASSAAGANSIPPYAPYRSLTMVHAVQQPKPPSGLTVSVISRNPGDTSVTITGGFTVDGATSSSVDLSAAWSDFVDVEPGAGVQPLTDGTNRSYVVKSGRLESWTLQRSDTSVAYPTPAIGNVDAISIVQQLGDTKTRQLFYQATATSRFREYFPASLQASASNFQSSEPAGAFSASTLLFTNGGIRIPSTARPAAPKILYVVPTYEWSSTSTARTKTTTNARAGRGLRVFVDRPWFMTGDTEELGVVVTPLGTPSSTLAGYVSQWGPDPIRFPQADVLPALDQTQVVGGTINTGVPLAENSSDLVTVISFPPTAYDPSRKLWYFDIEFAETTIEAPFVRLALVRFQPNSLGCPAFPNSPADLRMSNVVLADMVKLSADRTASYVLSGTAPNLIFTVTVAGQVLADESWVASTGTLTTNTVNGPAASGRAVYAQILESVAASPGEFDWYPVGAPVVLTPYQLAGSAGSSTALSFTGSVLQPKPTAMVAGSKHQLLITEHEVFLTDAQAAFPGAQTVTNFPPGAMQPFVAKPPQTPVFYSDTTSRIIFSDILPLPY